MEGDVSTKQRRKTRLLAATLGMAIAASGLAACSGGGDGAQEVHFVFSKREAIDFMKGVVADYNSSQDEYRVVLDTSGIDTMSASFVRGNPPDLGLTNYNMETSRFVERCTLSDLSDLDAAKTINPDLQPLMDQYGKCEGRISAFPYSIMASSVIYNKEIFEQYGLEVPQTWDELLALCEELKANGIDPFYATFSSGDSWTIGQGWYDYAVGGSIDVIDFFDKLKAEGTDVGPDSEVSFEKDFAEPVTKMRYLADNYVNPDAKNRSYNEGNQNFAEGKAAMYLQGPWAFPEIAKISPDLQLGTFPLPMTDDPEDLKVRVNVDLAAWVPVEAANPEGARDFLEYLYQPEIIQAYNENQLGIAPVTGVDLIDDPRVEGSLSYYLDSKFYQGPSVLVDKTIPLFNYTQEMLIDSDPTAPLATLDSDWARLAIRR